MLPDLYRVLKFGSLEDAYRALDRCRFIVKRAEEYPQFSGYGRTAEKFIPQLEEHIKKLRDQGEKTVIEVIAECTGNTFIPMESGVGQPRIINFRW